MTRAEFDAWIKPDGVTRKVLVEKKPASAKQRKKFLNNNRCITMRVSESTSNAVIQVRLVSARPQYDRYGLVELVALYKEDPEYNAHSWVRSCYQLNTPIKVAVGSHLYADWKDMTIREISVGVWATRIVLWRIGHA